MVFLDPYNFNGLIIKGSIKAYQKRIKAAYSIKRKHLLGTDIQIQQPEFCLFIEPRLLLLVLFVNFSLRQVDKTGYVFNNFKKFFNVVRNGKSHLQKVIGTFL